MADVPWWRRAAAWLRANVWGMVAALVAALGAGIFWTYHRGRIRKLEDQNAIEKAHREVAALDARRRVLSEQTQANAEDIQAIQKKRQDLTREAVALEHDIADLSDEEVEAAFRGLY